MEKSVKSEKSLQNNVDKRARTNESEQKLEAKKSCQKNQEKRVLIMGKNGMMHGLPQNVQFPLKKCRIENVLSLCKSVVQIQIKTLSF